MYTARQKVFWFAILSRIVVLLLQMLFNAICPDHEADAFQSPVDTTDKQNSNLDKIVNFVFGGLTKWDAQYFIHIARYGYTYENTLAFFPLFPITMKYVAMVFHVEPPILNHNNRIVILGFIINFVCFIKAALIMYDLSEVVFKDVRIAYRASILFCINPASIFFTALYTEAMFAYLTFYTMLESIKLNSCVFVPLGFSTLVRSNGLVNIGFPVYMWLRNFIVTSIPNFISEYKLYNSGKKCFLFNFRHIFLSIAQLVMLVILALIPFYLLQSYNYTTFCKLGMNETLPYHVQQYALENDLLILGKDKLEWCNLKLPMAYSYIQSKYWNVGFMRYYQFKQIPNFILAIPILYLMLKCSIEFFKEHRSKILTLEFYTGVTKNKKFKNEKYPLEIFVFVVHGLFLTIFCIFFVHIQVSTRLLCSASPLLYWYCALATLEEDKTTENRKKLEYEYADNLNSKWKVFFLTQKPTPVEKQIYGYFIGYVVVGCFMYSNFLPWT